MDGKQAKQTVILSESTRRRLELITRNGSAPAKKILHARVLLMADRDHPDGRYRDAQIAQALGVHPNTVANIRRKFVRDGEQAALERKARHTPPIPPKLDGPAEAALIALCCSPPPPGRVRWTMSLLASELVQRQVVVSISAEAVRQRLKKTSCSPGASSGFASPSATRRALWLRWRRCWTSTPSRPTPTSR